MKHLAWALFCAFLFALTTASGAVTVQITVFCNGGVSYDSAVTVTAPNPTAYDALVESGVAELDSWGSYGYYVKSIAGCGGEYGPAFYINGEESPSGISSTPIEDGDQLQFIGPNSGSYTAGILYLAEVPDAVNNNEPFRIAVKERFVWGMYDDRPSSGAEVTVGNDTYQTGSDGYTEEITLDYDAYYCVAAEKGGYVATYHFDGIPSIQCGIGGPYICGISVGGAKKAIIKYDESSSISGEGFSLSRSVFENSGSQYPRRSTKVYQKGSGSYNVEKIIKQRPSGIDFSESSELKHNPTTFKAYNRMLGYDTKYEDSIYQKNYLKATQLSERYRGLDFLNKTSLYNNSRGINFTFIADFQGTAELSARTFEDNVLTDWPKKAKLEEELFGEYVGSFHIFQRGLLPLSEGSVPDCEEECELNCFKHCTEDLGYTEEYCHENCTEYCEEYCASDEEDYELLPCCSGGWSNMTEVDRNEHSADGIFGCTSCNKV